ncbi:excisionase [Porphyromonas macacae]|uniref:Excisionase n=1 Tax=Porphyromonas macacae TaxID=28115 RepID=A0A0A2E4V7_9PORP|nr:helix-turn-helix domain-containing protein [Porphyromonas macacae]KGN72480.1 excisionase [Porphyromonas macacae]
MCSQIFDSLPEAVGYLTEQVLKIKKILGTLHAQPSSSTNRLIDIEEASALIQKAKPTIYALVRKGFLPACKRGKKLYFYERERHEWIEKGRRGHNTPTSSDEMLSQIQSLVRHKPKSLKYL